MTTRNEVLEEAALSLDTACPNSAAHIRSLKTTPDQPLSPQVDDGMVERAAKAHYEKYFEGVTEFEPVWAAPDSGKESYFYRMREAMRAALLAALKTEG